MEKASMATGLLLLAFVEDRLLSLPLLRIKRLRKERQSVALSSLGLALPYPLAVYDQ
jgi:hypothetical protein